MCIAALGPVLSIAGTTLSFVSKMQQADMTEKIAERNAKIEEYRGRYEAKQLERKLRYTQGAATAQAGANGIATHEGSFMDILADNEIQGNIDAENARRNATNRADSARLEGRSAASRARSGAVSSIITGGTSFLRMVA